MAKPTLDAHAEFDARQAIDSELALQRSVEARARQTGMAAMQFSGHRIDQREQFALHVGD